MIFIMQNTISSYLAITLLFLLSGCANVRSPQGGSKDTTPPVVVSTYPEPMALHFSSHSITLIFDEYVKLNSIFSEMIVSPPLSKPPKIKVHKKAVILELQEELRPNTTYQFNFGDGIMDVNESNKVKDLTYVFSTGDMIDSLSISGVVWDALNDKPSSGMKVVMYENDTSIFSKNAIPLYFSRVKGDGSFAINYLKSGNYYLYALDDQNGNYRHDEGEAIGVLDRSVDIGKDSSLQLFTSVPYPERLFIQEYAVDSVGTLKFALQAHYKNVTVQPMNQELSAQFNRSNDSVYVHLQGFPTNTRELLVIQIDNNFVDTVAIPYFTEALKKPFALQTSKGNKRKVGDSITLRSKSQLHLKNRDRISLTHDSVPVDFELTYDSLHMNFQLKTTFKEGQHYQLRVFPGAFENEIGVTHDSLDYSFDIFQQDELSTLVMNLQLPDSLKNGLLQLLDKQNNIIFQQSGIASGSYSVKALLPGEYILRLLDDSNKNSIFDPIHFFPYSPPERMYLYPGAITLRSNWDLKIDWNVSLDLLPIEK